jgi:hypothetical protein
VSLINSERNAATEEFKFFVFVFVGGNVSLNPLAQVCSEIPVVECP